MYDLKLASESKPLGVTGAHPFWSVDREAWVSVLDLEIGERLKTLEGTTVVESRNRRPEPEPVYNIEVEGDHVYRVGESGVLVHNASGWTDDELTKGEAKFNFYVVAAAKRRGSGAKSSTNDALYLGKRNLGRLKYKDKDGNEKWYKPKSFVIGTAGAGKHAEAQMQIFLEGLEGYGCGVEVLEVFTERYPCATRITLHLDELGHKNQGKSFTVYWFAPHGKNFDTDPGGKQLLDAYDAVGLLPFPKT